MYCTILDIGQVLFLRVYIMDRDAVEVHKLVN